ncbi:hypothetical protein BT67DRAFT_459063 [Trichocladium antarcticum]|uniref:Aminoglycoside phosphotransferase domain-containing protein n=1 Tax=Trichocladium antarcticum TaxID=1450529 RepID=A0AAN6UBF6_9PEZI|nr:hypothetical protein BT67DRAFT_459063 [Trichocladium antarcticum]
MDGTKGLAPAGQTSSNRVVKVNRTTVAARYNIKVLRGLETALLMYPEANLDDLLSSSYPQQLKLHGTDPATIVHELSPELQDLLGHHEQLSEAAIKLLDESEVLYKSAWAASCMVFRGSDGIVAKVTLEEHITTEYRTLPCLQEQVRISPKPVVNVSEFEDFIFTGSKTASHMYTQFLPSLMPESQAKVVFTHGDSRPANIMVRRDEEGSWTVVSIIDWESSGSYPKYWECVKMTNILSPRHRDDWYLLLPEFLSPRQFPVQWLRIGTGTKVMKKRRTIISSTPTLLFLSRLILSRITPLAYWREGSALAAQVSPASQANARDLQQFKPCPEGPAESSDPPSVPSQASSGTSSLERRNEEDKGNIADGQDTAETSDSECGSPIQLPSPPRDKPPPQRKHRYGYTPSCFHCLSFTDPNFVSF